MRGIRFPWAVLVLAASAAPLSAEVPWPEVRLVRKLGGLSNPVHVTHAGDRSGRLFVVEQRGRIRIVRSGAVVPAPYLDIASRVTCCGERGLLSVAFPPGFATSRRFYVDYTDTNGDTAISRFSVPAGTPDTADAASEEVLLRIPQPYANHNGGQLAFGPDGFLYVGMGDGGSGGDPQNHAQNPASLLGKILRIDVESGAAPYSIPPSNPFVGNPAYRPEIWALGLRNPWRFSFDRRTSDLFIGDVGQNAREEVDFQPASSRGGENYGWRIMEGTACYNPANCSSSGLVLPVAEYSHAGGDCSVTGGFVYRGLSYSRLDGIYFYADYCTGRMHGLRRNGSAWESRELLRAGFTLSTFGEDEAGELYVADHGGGALYQVADVAGTSSALTVPVVLDVVGAGGARFTSELTLGNRGTTPVSLAVTYIPATSLGASGGGTLSEQLGAGRQTTIPDAITWLRQKGLAIPTSGDQGGTLRIVASGASAGDAAFASARTTAPSGSGRAGLAYPALSANEAAESPVVLFGLREDAAFRSNLGLVNLADPDSATTSVFRVTLTSGDPADVRSVPLAPLTLEAGQWLQLNQVLRRAGITNGWATVERVGGSDPFHAYGVVNDNDTDDGSFVPPVAAGRKTVSLMLPVAVSTGGFSTEGVLANPGTASLSLSIAGSNQVVLGPGEQRFIPDFLAFAGYIVSPVAAAVSISVASGAPGTFFAGARTFAAAPGGGGGSYGLFYAALPFGDGATDEAWIHGLRQDGLARSNLAVANVTDRNVVHAGVEPFLTLTADVFDGSTGLLAGSVDLTLDGLGADWRQVNGILARFGLSNGYARVRVSGTAPLPFLAYGVVNDGAAPGAGTSDGSFLTMSRPLPPSPFQP